eukprot:NODE_1963_length_1023_cov_86.097536_g1595_i0.p2 GENE.NODE_1963_length_1023_cov_86.097536_g1595_i0~~NODE_1963_length_1023_cov_86.097536_g1595_i0.p2  ORF type:complete len:128 (-),score=20.01 NODE_1963_length_1023_cov_86.097536_g1595_i0:376-759(-)
MFPSRNAPNYGETVWLPLAGYDYAIAIDGLRVGDVEVISGDSGAFGEALLDTGTSNIMLSRKAHQLLKDAYQKAYKDLPAVVSDTGFWKPCEKDGKGHCAYCLKDSKGSRHTPFFSGRRALETRGRH